MKTKALLFSLTLLLLLAPGCKNASKETAAPAPSKEQGLSDEALKDLLEGTAVPDSTSLYESAIESEPLGEE